MSQIRSEALSFGLTRDPVALVAGAVLALTALHLGMRAEQRQRILLVADRQNQGCFTQRLGADRLGQPDRGS